MQSKEEESEKVILEAFPKVQIDIPILGVTKQVIECVEFFKEFCTTRRMIQEEEVTGEYLAPIKKDVFRLTIKEGIGVDHKGHATALKTSYLAEFSIPKTFEVVFILEFLSEHTGKPPSRISISFSTNMLISMIQAPTFEFKPLPDHFKYHLPFKDQFHVVDPNGA